MAMEAKASFIRQIEKTLSDKITVADAAKVMAAISDALEGYEMRSVDTWTDETDDLLQCYISALAVENRSQKTIDRYRYVLARMIGHVRVPVRKITVYHLREYLAALKGKGMADSSLEGTREVMVAFFNWLQRESLIEKNPAANLGAIKCARKEKKIYTEIEIDELQRNCRTVRDRAIIHLLAATGCRIGELVAMNREDIDLEKLEGIVRGKGNKMRVVYMDELTAQLIRQYLTGRKDNNEALFVGKRGRLKENGVRVMLHNVAMRAGIKNVHPHKFRRTLATELSRRGMPIQEVARILGHEKIDTTMKYVVLNDDDIKHSYRRYA